MCPLSAKSWLMDGSYVPFAVVHRVCKYVGAKVGNRPICDIYQ